MSRKFLFGAILGVAGAFIGALWADPSWRFGALHFDFHQPAPAVVTECDRIYCHQMDDHEEWVLLFGDISEEDIAEWESDYGVRLFAHRYPSIVSATQIIWSTQANCGSRNAIVMLQTSTSSGAVTPIVACCN